jgi:pyruvate formate lyase activating enzyme
MVASQFAIKGFLETSFLEWPGKIASVIFLPGCNFRCPYCHNHPLILAPEQLPIIPLEAIISFLEGQRDWVDGVVITGGEPTLCKELPFLIQHFRERGFRVKLDTNGSNPALLKELLDNHLLDYVAMDIKAPLEENKYNSVTGVKMDLSKITASIRLLLNADIPYEFRTTILPLFLTPEDVMDIGSAIKGAKKYVLQNFSSQNPLEPRLREESPYSSVDLEEMARRLRGYVANIQAIY